MKIFDNYSKFLPLPPPADCGQLLNFGSNNCNYLKNFNPPDINYSLFRIIPYWLYLLFVLKY